MKLDHRMSAVYAKHAGLTERYKGQWAKVLGVVYAPERHGSDPRPGMACLHVQYVNGDDDFWPMHEMGQIDFVSYLP